MILTKEIFEKGKSSNGGYNDLQIKELGIVNKTKGWVRLIIGKDIPQENINRFLALKNAHFSPDREAQLLNRINKNNLNPYKFVEVLTNLSYKDQYLHPNWQKMRLVILKRDGFKCLECGDVNSVLHAHHLKYLKDKFIWQVPKWYIVTLCEKCHSLEHNRDLTIHR